MVVLYTIFTWLNTAAAINQVSKIDVATIQGRCLLHKLGTEQLLIVATIHYINVLRINLFCISTMCTKKGL